MNLFKKLLGRGESATVGGRTPDDPLSERAGQPAMITVFDGYGREMKITRKDWVVSVLRPGLRQARKDPEELSGLIIGALQDGFFSEVEEAAVQLHGIDPNPARGAVLLAIVYLQTDRPALAAKLLADHIARHGEDGIVLTNLAKAQDALGRGQESVETLWRALELDPNQDNGLEWYTTIHQESEGSEGWLRALYRIAALPRSWRARLWLARHALEHGRLEDALSHYATSLEQAGEPSPPDLLMQLSGDLGNQGHLPQILDLVLPRFRPAVHGLMVGNNLLKAAIDLGRLDLARSLLEDLQSQQRPDWREHLGFWDAEIGKARLDIEPTRGAAELKISLLAIDGPVWLPSQGPLAELFPAPPPEAATIAFLGSSATLSTGEDAYKLKPAGSIGRATRAFPIALAENFRFLAGCDTRALIPWIDQGGFILSGKPIGDTDTCQHARNGGRPADYAVATHLDATSDTWRVNLRVLRTIDARLLGEETIAFPAKCPGHALPRMVECIAALLAAEDAAATQLPPEYFQPPGTVHLDDYLLRLEQCLAVRCSTMPGAAESISNPAEILDGMIQLCLDHPQSVSCRCLLVETLGRLGKTQPALARSFLPKIGRLASEHPLPPVANAAISEALARMAA